MGRLTFFERQRLRFDVRDEGRCDPVAAAHQGEAAALLEDHELELGGPLEHVALRRHTPQGSGGGRSRLAVGETPEERGKSAASARANLPLSFGVPTRPPRTPPTGTSERIGERGAGPESPVQQHDHRQGQ